jgi:hypothetical protein
MAKYSESFPVMIKHKKNRKDLDHRSQLIKLVRLYFTHSVVPFVNLLLSIKPPTVWDEQHTLPKVIHRSKTTLSIGGDSQLAQLVVVERGRSYANNMSGLPSGSVSGGGGSGLEVVKNTENFIQVTLFFVALFFFSIF